MSNEQFDELAEPSDQQIERAVEEPGPDDAALIYTDREAVDLVEIAEEENRGGESEVMEEDLSSDDRIQDGALPEDLEQSNIGQREFVEDQADPSRQATIDSRIRQEEPEPGFDVVPDDEPARVDPEDLP